MASVGSQKTGRKRTGTLETHGAHADGSPRYRYRVRLADGAKSERFDVPHGLNEGQSRAFVASIQAQEDAHGLLLAKKREAAKGAAANAGEAFEGETADTWHARFMVSRIGLVATSAHTHSKSNWAKWISPHLGKKPMVTITRDDIEVVRDGLDAAVAAFHAQGRGPDRLMPKSAQNIWAVVTTAFKSACQAKRASGLRVREDNPCFNVLAPTNGASRRKAWIYPNEFLQLVSCVDIPAAWRELYALACYLYLRPGELYELRVRDVDLDGEVVAVSRAWDWDDENAKAPKTENGIREVPIHPGLLPMLTRMIDGKALDAKVVPIFEQVSVHRIAELLRSHLALAGVNHPRLLDNTSTHMPIGFRSWRDTGITWAAIEGVSLQTLQRRAGRDDPKTTSGYVKEAEDRPKLRGRTFPMLPADPVWPNVRPSEAPIYRESSRESGGGVGNRTPVRKSLNIVSTCVAEYLYRPSSRHSASSPSG